MQQHLHFKRLVILRYCQIDAGENLESFLQYCRFYVAVAVRCTSALNLIWCRITADQFTSLTLVLCLFDLLDIKFSSKYTQVSTIILQCVMSLFLGCNNRVFQVPSDVASTAGSGVLLSISLLKIDCKMLFLAVVHVFIAMKTF
jgi:hypothetical protein